MSPSLMTLASDSAKLHPVPYFAPKATPPVLAPFPFEDVQPPKRQRRAPLAPQPEAPLCHAPDKRPRTPPRAPPPNDFFTPEPSYSVTDRSPLHLAVLHSKFDEAKSLLQAGADVEARDSNGETPLHYAAEHDFIHLLELLLHRGADPYAVDKLGDTPLHAAAAAGKSGTAMLLLRTMQKDRRHLPAWPDEARVHALLTGFRQGPEDTNMYSAVDRLMHDLTGSSTNLNNDFDVLKYVGHLLSLKDMVVCLPAEGWNQVGFFFQRLRSFVTMYLHPAPLPASLAALMTANEARALLEREIVGMLTSLNVMRHVRDTRRLNEPPRHAICSIMATQIMDTVADLKHGEGFTLPLGLPTHAIYLNLMPQVIGDREVMAFRLDNLGLGCDVATSKDARGRVPPFAFNLPKDYMESPAGKTRVGELVAQLLQYLTDPQVGIDMVYAQMTLLLRELHASYPTALIDSVDQDKYARDPQTVGNCSLKNHSAGIWTRLAMAMEAKAPNATPETQHDLGAQLWRWVSKQEITLALTRMHEFVVTPRAMLYRHELLKADQLRQIIVHPHGSGEVEAFLASPFREGVAVALSADDVQPVVHQGRLDDLKALLAHGFDPLTKPKVRDDGTLLHTAVRSESAQAAEMVQLLLAHGCLPSAQDDRKRTPFMLAAELGQADVMAALQPCSSEADRQAALASLRGQIHNLQRSLGMLVPGPAACFTTPAPETTRQAGIVTLG